MTEAPTQSYKKVAYDVRPAKQVERRMMFDALQILSRSGFDIADYQYTGFGSIFFVDFVLFHRYLGLTKLLTVEHDTTIERRVRFNKPFELIEVEIKSAAEVIPTLHPDRRHILWLDYDDTLKSWMINDIASALDQLSVGSLLLVTVDVEPPIRGGSAEDSAAYFRDQVGDLIPHDWTPEHFGREKLPSSVRAILKKTVESSLAYRTGVSFLPLFSFLYADRNLMYTFGGMIGGATERRKLRQVEFESAPYIRNSLDEEPFTIYVPKLTRKERVLLDANMPAADGWQPAEFELDKADVDAYRAIYRFFPMYVEVF